MTPAHPWPEDGDVRELVRALTEVLAEFATKRGHKALVVENESLGVCTMLYPVERRCSRACVAYWDVLERAAGYLEAHPEQAPARQLALLADGRAG